MSLRSDNTNQDEYMEIDDIHKKEAHDNDEEEVSYWGLLQGNRSFRLYLMSYLLDHLGEWFTYIAAVSLIEEFQGGAENASRTAISVLIIVRLAPHILFSTIGGAIADSRDKRLFMISSELVGAVIALFYLVAFYSRSISMIYLVNFIQELNTALYEPNRSSIVPMMVHNNEELKKATILSGMVWSLMTAFGAALGGFTVAAFGPIVCFLLDSLTFLASAVCMWLVGGEWKSIDKDTSLGGRSFVMTFVDLIGEGFLYLKSSFWGPLVLLKATAAASFGSTDVLNVAYSERSTAVDASIKLGLLFAIAGVGDIFGPLAAEPFNDMKRIRTLQRVSVISLCIGAVGCLGMGIFYPFCFIMIFTFIRSAGNCVAWINSTLLLQTLSAPEKMGRVLAIDYALGLLGEASSALACGALIDSLDFIPEHANFLIGGIGLVLSLLWVYYDFSGKGCAREGVDEWLKARQDVIANNKHADETTSLL